jgi:hypothetical protein
MEKAKEEKAAHGELETQTPWVFRRSGHLFCGNTMNISCIWVLRTLSILRQKLEAHKQIEFMSIFHRTKGDDF